MTSIRCNYISNLFKINIWQNVKFQNSWYFSVKALILWKQVDFTNFFQLLNAKLFYFRNLTICYKTFYYLFVRNIDDFKTELNSRCYYRTAKKNWIKIGQEMTRLGLHYLWLHENFPISRIWMVLLLNVFSAIAYSTKMARKSNASKNQEEFRAILWNGNLRIFAFTIESIQVRRFSWIHPNAKSKSNSKKVLFLSLLVRELSEY